MIWWEGTQCHWIFHSDTHYKYFASLTIFCYSKVSVAQSQLHSHHLFCLSWTSLISPTDLVTFSDVLYQQLPEWSEREQCHLIFHSDTHYNYIASLTMFGYSKVSVARTEPITHTSLTRWVKCCKLNIEVWKTELVTPQYLDTWRCATVLRNVTYSPSLQFAHRKCGHSDSYRVSQEMGQM